MRVSSKSGELRTRSKYRAVSAAAISTVATAGLGHGLTQGAILPTPELGNLPSSQIGYIGPVPVGNNTVATGNTFSISVVGFNIANTSSGFVVNDEAYLVGPITPTFGTTKTLTNATLDGETATVTSSETATKGVTTDKITVSVPTRFVPIGTTFTDGDLIDEEDLELGFASGSGLTFTTPVTTKITASGTASYGPVTGKKDTYTFSQTKGSAPYTYLNPTGTVLEADEGLETLDPASPYTTYDFTAYNLSSFSFSFSYATPSPVVPEPATGMIGMVIGSVGLLRRRSRTGSSPIVPLSTGLVDGPTPSSDGLSNMTALVAEQSRSEGHSVSEETLI